MRYLKVVLLACAIVALVPLVPLTSEAQSSPIVQATMRSRVTARPVASTSEPLPWYTDRDCGFSTRLLSPATPQRWFSMFCDTKVWNANGTFRGAGTNTGGTLNLVGSSDPVIVRDGTGASSPPYPSQLIDTPPTASASCPTANGGYTATWPQSIAAIPDGNTSNDLLAVYFQVYCVAQVAQVPTYLSKGVGVGLFVYDPANPGAKLRIANNDPNLYRFPIFPGTYSWTPTPYPDDSYAFGASVHGSYLHVQQCGTSGGVGQGKCHVKRVALTGTAWTDIVAIGDPNAYEDLLANGTWGTATVAAPPRNVADPDGTHASDPLYRPLGGAAITKIRYLNRYLMMYRAAGGAGRFVVRHAATPYGPWTTPVEVTVTTSCGGGPFGCYQPVIQEAMYVGGSNTIGFTFFDPSVQTVPNFPNPPLPQTGPAGPVNGTLRAATIPGSALGLTAPDPEP